MSCRRCGALCREDTQFTAEMVVYGMPQRRYVCASGHSVTLHVPVVDRAKPVPGNHIPARQMPKVCVWCGEAFIGITRQKYCGTACVRAVDAERTRGRTRGGYPAMTGLALRQARAVTFPRRRMTPTPYATRPQGLNKAWV